MLRITDGMLVNNARRQMNSNLLSLDTYQRQISSGTIISRPSDNPAGTVKSLRLRTSLMEGEQYLANINEAVSFMETTDSSLDNVDQIIQAIRQKAVAAATGSNNSQSFSAIAQEIGELKDQLKIIANATCGSKYIFAGTNVTETPYENGKWNGNEDSLDVEIGVGVTASINITQMKEFFMGRMEFSKNLDTATGISNLAVQNLKEGEYELKTQAGAASIAANSTIKEAQSYLTSVSNNKSFFYEDIQHAATLGVGTGVGTTDASYSGSLALEVTKVDQAPHMFLTDGSTANRIVMEVDQSLFTKNANGTVIPLVNDQDVTAMFNMAGLPAGWTAVYNDNGKGVVTVTFSGATAAVAGNAFALAAGQNLCSSQGDAYVPSTATFDGANWAYHGTSTVTANVIGHIYATDGTQRDINLKNVILNVEAGAGVAAGANREIFRIKAADIDPSVPVNPLFANDLVIWNAGVNALGGTDIRTPGLKAGDKTVLALGAQVAANAEQIGVNYSFTNIDGKQVGNGAHNYVFANGTMDNRTRDLQFYEIDQETGVLTDATMTFKTNTLGTSPVAPATAPAAKFTFTTGIFGWVGELVGTIQAGKLPQVGNMLKGTDNRLQELLYHRSTLGARINRLELQQSRLTSSAESMTELLSKNEDTDEAKVLMELKQQENVYQASLAVSARIIQPTLMDFLS